jgi:hypothetical protein
MESGEINDRLCSDKYSFVSDHDISNQGKKQGYIRKNFDELSKFIESKINYMNQHEEFYNESKLCLSRDFETAESDGSAKAYICRSCYFDTFVTNICYNYYLHNAVREVDDTSGRELHNRDAQPYRVIDGKKVIEPLELSEFGDEIGISALCITNDGFMFLLKQNIKAQSSINRMVPPGSGSADWRDYGGEKDFKKVIGGAMLRELYEECGLKSHYRSARECGEVRLTGYFRWANKTFKPEFTGIVRLNCGINEVSPNIKEVTERAYCKTIVKDVKGLRQFRDAVYSYCKQNEREESAEKKKSMSVPLVMCIDNLLAAVENKEYGNLFRRFMNLKN